MNIKDYIVVPAFAITDLQLKGNELLIYSLIFGFSKDGCSKFCGSANYIAESCNCSKRAVMDTLKSLVDKNYLIKTDKVVNNVRLVDYQVNMDYVYKTSYPMQNLHTPCAESAHHNTKDKKDNNNINIIITERKENEESKILNNWNKIADKFGLAKISLVSKTRLQHYKARIQECNEDSNLFWNVIYSKLENDKKGFFTGNNDRGWKADFDYFTTQSKFIKILEEYNERNK